jgi:hypothetical protein
MTLDFNKETASPTPTIVSTFFVSSCELLCASYELLVLNKPITETFATE